MSGLNFIYRNLAEAHAGEKNLPRRFFPPGVLVTRGIFRKVRCALSLYGAELTFMPLTFENESKFG
jgi:hypothetical protein